MKSVDSTHTDRGGASPSLVGNAAREAEKGTKLSGQEERVTASPDALAEWLEAVFAEEPTLRPDPRMRDYQLTYPPAVQIEQPAYRKTPSGAEYLATLSGPINTAGYYFHFGYCQYRCRYCFHYEIRIREQEERMARYVDALLCEARRMRTITPHLRQVLTFLGGGTPTALPERLLRRFTEGYGEIFGRPASKMSTVEAKPITATQEKLRIFFDAGFARVNFGVQTLDPALYAFHHHGEDVEVAVAALQRAREIGYTWINIDLMIGLERETAESWTRTLERCSELIRQGLLDSVFVYPFHDDPRSRTYQHEGLCPAAQQVFWADAQARSHFEALGWLELGPRFFRSPAHAACEFNEVMRLKVVPGYGDTLWLGFGNSAFSVADESTYLNIRDAERYCEKVEAGEFAIEHFRTLNRPQQAARDLTFALLYAPWIAAGRVAQKYGAETVARHVPQLRRWAELGLGTFDDEWQLFTLNRLGKLLHQQMIPQLYLPEDRRDFDLVMIRRKEAGRAYRGY